MRNTSKNNPFAGILFGIIFLIAGTIMLWWNEGDNVKNIKTVKELREQYIDVGSDSIDSSNEGKLIATNGEFVVNDEYISDNEFSLDVKTAKLNRIVEMYQWEEKENTDDNDNKTYTYSKKWSTSLISSSSFHNSSYSNPTSMPYKEKTFYADSANIGAFSLSKSQIENLSLSAALSLNSNLTLPAGFTISDNYITNAADINNPQVGDIRISYKYNDYKEASVLAVQNGSSFVDFVSTQGKKINKIMEGKLTGSQLIDSIEKDNNMMKWIFRGIGALLICFGYMLLISPITTLASFVPILGGIVGSALNLIAFLIGIVHALIVIIIAWFRYRPLLSVALIIVVMVLLVIIKKLISNQKDNTISDINEPLNVNTQNPTVNSAQPMSSVNTQNPTVNSAQPMNNNISNSNNISNN